MEQLPCRECGEPFERTRRGGAPQVYCTRDCCRAAGSRKSAARQRESTARTRVTRPVVCAECGGAIVQPDRGRPRRYCSMKCNARVQNRRMNRRRLPLADPLPTPRDCAHCGTAFTPKRRDQIYCYNESAAPYCAVLAYQARRRAGEPLRQVEQQLRCQECGSEFTAFKSNARWCSQKCKNRNTSRVMSRRRVAATPGRTPYTDLEIFERDGWRCHLCRKKVKKSVPRTHPDGATIDHLVPISLGGVDEPANVATAHWRCNHEKRARMLDHQLALI